MSILNAHRPDASSSTEGFSWNIKVSEKVLLTILLVGSSFTSGFNYGQSKAASKSPVLPAQNAQCSTITVNNGFHR
jgi:hypothetical protein